MADKTKDVKKDDARMSSIAKTLNKKRELRFRRRRIGERRQSERTTELGMDVAADPAIAIPSRHEGIGHRWRFHSWF